MIGLIVGLTASTICFWIWYVLSQIKVHILSFESQWCYCKMHIKSAAAVFPSAAVICVDKLCHFNQWSKHFMLVINQTMFPLPQQLIFYHWSCQAVFVPLVFHSEKGPDLKIAPCVSFAERNTFQRVWLKNVRADLFCYVLEGQIESLKDIQLGRDTEKRHRQQTDRECGRYDSFNGSMCQAKTEGRQPQKVVENDPRWVTISGHSHSLQGHFLLILHLFVIVAHCMDWVHTALTEAQQTYCIEWYMYMEEKINIGPWKSSCYELNSNSKQPYLCI